MVRGICVLMGLLLMGVSASAEPTAAEIVRDGYYSVWSNIGGWTGIQTTECIGSTPKSEYKGSSAIDLLSPDCVQITFDSKESMQNAVAVFGKAFSVDGVSVYLGPVSVSVVPTFPLDGGSAIEPL